MKEIAWRRVASLLSLFLFVFAVLTGIVLYIVPPTRVANALAWTVLGFSKGEYVRVHTIASFCFLMVGIWHIWFNWEALKEYLLPQSKEKWRSEPLLAAGMVVLLMAGTVANVWPVSAVMDFGQTVKESWGGPGGGGVRERCGHDINVTMTLAAFATENHKDVRGLVEKLARKGWKARGNQTIADIAKHNGVATEEIMKELQ